MLELLKTHFGYDEFLPLQQEIIASVMAGRDTFALMPTGGGKSLCYQLPAMALPGVTLVVSPLIALMKDQVDALEANGIPAAFINSSQTQAELSQVVGRLRAREIKLLYVAPERAIEPRFAEFLRTLSVSLIAIDEAHCVSEWGHEFRPAYRELRDLRRSCPDAPVITLTATATSQVRGDILSQLGLQDPAIYVSSFNRPNLTYSIVPKERDLSVLLELLEKHRGESAIIYCGSRKETEDMAATLKERGFSAEPYHAGLDNDVRRSTQERFIRDHTSIVTATIAFGMGINKPDVRLVVHYDLPKSVESYYQETGRAGRDGLPAECVLFYSYAGKSRQEFFINQIEDGEERERARQRLERVIALCTLNSCLRRYVLQYLGEEWPEENCGGCDNCTGPREEYDATEIAQKVLSAVIRTGERFGAAHVIGVLRGSKSERVLAQGHDQLSVHGIAADQSRDDLRDLVEGLKREGLLSVSEGEYPTLRVTERGREFLRNRERLSLSRPPVRRIEASPERGADRGAGGDYNAGLYTELAALRRQIAEERGVPPYIVFSNRTLQDMARKAPRTTEEFADVSGVGRAKLEDFGAPFLERINAYARQHGWPEATRQWRQARQVRAGHADCKPNTAGDGADHIHGSLAGRGRRRQRSGGHYYPGTPGAIGRGGGGCGVVAPGPTSGNTRRNRFRRQSCRGCVAAPGIRRTWRQVQLRRNSHGPPRPAERRKVSGRRASHVDRTRPEVDDGAGRTCGRGSETVVFAPTLPLRGDAGAYSPREAASSRRCCFGSPRKW